MNNRALTIAAVILIGWAVVRHVDRHYFAWDIGSGPGVCVRDHEIDAEVDRGVEATVNRSIESSLNGVDFVDAVDVMDIDSDSDVETDDVYAASDRECLREQLRQNIYDSRNQVIQGRDEMRHNLEANRLDRERVRHEIRRSMRDARDQWREEMRGSISEMRERRSELRDQMRQRREELKQEIREAVRAAKENSRIY